MPTDPQTPPPCPQTLNPTYMPTDPKTIFLYIHVCNLQDLGALLPGGGAAAELSSVAAKCGAQLGDNEKRVAMSKARKHDYWRATLPSHLPPTLLMPHLHTPQGWRGAAHGGARIYRRAGCVRAAARRQAGAVEHRQAAGAAWALSQR
eukprot:356896-Chlamydomonas_euryale.AAC.3